MLGSDFGYWNTFLSKYIAAFILHNETLLPHATTTPPTPLIKFCPNIVSISPFAQGDCAVVL